jgi:hypothetical protein
MLHMGSTEHADTEHMVEHNKMGLKLRDWLHSAGIA